MLTSNHYTQHQTHAGLASQRMHVVMFQTVLKKVPQALACYLVTITIIYVFVPAGLDLFIFCEKCNMCQGHCIYYLEYMLYWFSHSN